MVLERQKLTRIGLPQGSGRRPAGRAQGGRVQGVVAQGRRAHRQRRVYLGVGFVNPPGKFGVKTTVGQVV
jgi:hypothetical protein